MTRKPDEERRAEARRLAGLGIPRGEIAQQLGAARSTVARWLGSQGRTGPAQRRDVPDAKIIDLRDRENLSFAQIGTLTGMSESGAKHRYRTAKGLPQYGRESAPKWRQGEPG